MADPTNDARTLVELAVDAHTDVMKLVSALHAAGAPPEAIQGLTKMGDALAGISKVLGGGQLGGQPQPGATQPTPGEPVPGPGAAGPPPGAGVPPAVSHAAGQAVGAGPGPAEHGAPTAPQSMHAATAQMSAKLAAAHANAQNQLAGTTLAK